MDIGIHKSGQGYWTRVMTATVIGIVTLATAAWLYKQMTVVSERLPRTAWTMTLGTPQAAPGASAAVVNPAAGQTVTLLGEPERGRREPTELGTGTVRSFDPASRSVVLGGLTMKPAPAPAGAAPSAPRTDYNAGDTRSIRLTDVAIPVQGRVTGQPSVGPELLGGSASALTIVIGFIIAYYFCAVRPSSVEFLISTDMEMKKVNWSTRKDIISSTWVVIFAAFFIAAALFTVDIAFKAFFQAIGVLAA